MRKKVHIRASNMAAFGAEDADTSCSCQVLDIFFDSHPVDMNHVVVFCGSRKGEI